jgi:hypothetical protein
MSRLAIFHPEAYQHSNRMAVDLDKLPIEVSSRDVGPSRVPLAKVLLAAKPSKC